jgi:hypothetical protein
MYDGRVGRWMTTDPYSQYHSPYLAMGNNPIRMIDPDGGNAESTHIDELGNVIGTANDGDNGVYVHAIGTTVKQINLKYSASNTSGGGTHIGNLGGSIDMGTSGIYVNKLANSANSANQALAEDFTFGDWVNNVKGGGVWDLKGNKKTIWGAAWAFDRGKDNKTRFISPNLTFEDASDFGNYHAGFTGSMFGICVPFQVIGAGLIEQYKDLTGKQFGQVAKQLMLILRTNMDEVDDHYWNTQGMSDGKHLKKELNLSSHNLLEVQRQ